jgi:hypothetical protein
VYDIRAYKENVIYAGELILSLGSRDSSVGIALG